MKFGLEDRHWEIVEALLVKPLKARGCSLWVFGSRARGDQKKYSDLDILISKPSETSFGDAELFLLGDSLAESNLPIKVDLVFENEVASSYLPQIQEEKILL